MAEPQNVAAPVSGQQKESSSLDEDFGNDFLTSWKSSKLGEDLIDFDVEDVPSKCRKPFNFDKLDDFELGSNFDKISSFKVDMSDLDFSSPVKKAERPTEKPAKETTKEEAKQQKFSFAFDFNELDRFSLDSDLLTGKNVSKQVKDGEGPDNPLKNAGIQGSRCNSFTSTDTLLKVKTDNTTTSRPREITEPGLDLSTSYHAQDDVSAETTGIFAEKVNADDQIKLDADNNTRELSDGASSEKVEATIAPGSSSLKSPSNNSLSHEAVQRFPLGPSVIDALKAQTTKEQEISTKSVSSSQSRNSSPVNSYNSRCVLPQTQRGSPNTRSELLRKQQLEDDFIRENHPVPEVTTCQKVLGNTPDADIQGKNLNDVKHVGGIKNPSSILSAALQSKLRSVEKVGAKEKSCVSLQLKSLNKSADSASPSTLALKKLHTDFNENETVHVSPAQEQGEPKNNVQSENVKSDTLKPINRCLAKEKFRLIGKEGNRHFEASCFQLHPSSMHHQSSGTAKSSAHDPIFNAFPKKSSPIISVQKSLKDEKISDASNITLSRLTKLNISAPKSSVPTLRSSNGNLAFPVNSLSKVSNPANKESQVFKNPPLKRKNLEEVKEDSVDLNPSKRTAVSPIERKLVEASPEVNVKVLLNPKDRQNDMRTDNITSPNGALVLGSMMNLDIPVLLDNDANVEKAEACTKELDDICNMLKRRHEEAKELLVRVMVTNNTLLMLNHPMLDEKIRSIQRFADSLKTKEFWKPS